MSTVKAMHIAFVTITLAATVSLLRDPVFGSESGLALIRELQWANRAGAFDGSERAAFVVDSGNGALACLAWPSTHQHEQETFHGAIPPGTIAIIHTHPITVTMPSRQDEDQSRRLGIPIYVLTPLLVSKAVPYSKSVVVHRGAWVRSPSGPAQCKPIEQKD
jgi:hypothetical protein